MRLGFFPTHGRRRYESAWLSFGKRQRPPDKCADLSGKVHVPKEKPSIISVPPIFFMQLISLFSVLKLQCFKSLLCIPIYKSISSYILHTIFPVLGKLWTLWFILMEHFHNITAPCKFSCWQYSADFNSIKCSLNERRQGVFDLSLSTIAYIVEIQKIGPLTEMDKRCASQLWCPDKCSYISM